MDAEDIKPLVRHLFDCLKSNVWPDGPTALTDFGIDSQEHYDALAIPVRRGEILIEDLARGLGNGPLLTKLVRSAPSNPHKSIEFKTPWDEMLPEDHHTKN